jgi:hypothetical protein
MWYDKDEIAVYEFQHEVLMVASSIMLLSEHDPRVVYEFPVERISLEETDEALGTMILKVAQRCRGLVDEPPTMHKEVLKALQFTSDPKLNKSDRSLNKSARYVHISRKHHSNTFLFSSSRTRKDGRKLFIDGELEAPKSDIIALAKQLRQAIELCLL